MANIVIGLIVAGVVIFAATKVVRDAKAKKCSCGSSCSDDKKCH